MIYHPDGHPLTDVVHTHDTRPYMILDQTLVQWFRRPRSKKRRIRRKWRKNPANWRPSPFIFQEHLILGSSAAYGHIPQAELNRPRYMMHPVTWRAALAKDPTIAARFVVLGDGNWRSQPAAPILKSHLITICQLEDILPFLAPLAKFGPIATAAAAFANHLRFHQYDIFPPSKSRASHAKSQTSLTAVSRLFSHGHETTGNGVWSQGIIPPKGGMNDTVRPSLSRFPVLRSQPLDTDTKS